MNHRLLALALGSTLLVPSLAHADTLSPGAGDFGAITRIGRGIKELSLETGFVFSQRTDKEKGVVPETSSTSLAVLGGAVFRYFVADNFVLGLHAGGFYRSVSSKTHALTSTVDGQTVSIPESEVKTSEAGFLGTLTASYYASLGGGLFIAPLVGAGGFVGSGQTTVPGTGGAADQTAKSSLAGVALRGGLGLVFYASNRFNLFARPEAIVYLGSSKPKKDDSGASASASSSDESRGFTRIDGGFTCGLSYVF